MQQHCNCNLLIILLLLAFIGCNHDNQVSETIESAKYLLDAHPDSALSILDGIKDKETSWTRAQRMLFELVYAQAKNKAFIPFTSDSVVLEVADYYDCHGTANDRMLAYYMVGCTYRDLDDAPTAIKYLNQAAESVDASDKECDLLTLMRVHSQLGGLSQAVGDFDNALQEDLIAEKIAWQAGDTLSALQLKWTQSCSLFDSHLYQQSLSLLDSIEYFIRKYNYPISPDLLYPLRIEERFENSDVYGAGKLLESYETALGITPQSPDEDITNVGYYHLKGRYYNMVGLPDSAIYQFRRQLQSKKLNLLTKTGRLEVKENYYRGLLNAYSLKHQTDSIEKYAKLYCIFNDSTTLEHASENVINAQSLYNYSKAQEQAYMSEQATMRLRMILLIIITTSGVAISILWKIYRQRIENDRQEIILQNAEYAQLLQNFEKSTMELQLFKSDVEQYKKEKEAENDRLHKALSLYQADSSDLKVWDEERNILSCEVATHLHALSAKGKEATQDEFDRLLLIAESGLPHFFSLITDKEVCLSDKEIIVTTLVRFRFLSTEIAVLTNLSPQRITNLKSAINKKLFHSPGAKTLEKRLIAMK